MKLRFNRNIIRWIIIVSSFVIVSLILWNTYVFFQHFNNEEREKMKSWTIAYSEFANSINLTTTEDIDINAVAQYIVLETSITTPMILVDSTKNIIEFRNIEGRGKLKEDSNLALKFNQKIDSAYVHDNKDFLLKKFEIENKPLELKALGQKLYYGNSPLLNKLKYYPLALLLIIILFSAVVYFFYRSTKTAQQNRLWTGMAKETAHQIGTPLSSLVGWTEILKSENVKQEYITEIEKDIDRLETITQRFSKIGSIPELKPEDIVEKTKASFDYLQSRTSKLINFNIQIPEKPIMANLNTHLYSWTIENLVKNAIDAMKGKGNLEMKLFQKENNVFIQVSDTGKGLSKSQFSKIFEPGYTTKKRGWGLGLSLAKRIIEDYHKGKIKVLKSEVGKGTTMQIVLKATS